ncbi:MAG: hypothetical protein JW904_07735 [Spirochaetales bacterium]|nr:hypothetical protein [Spirochaetales bacterium]
MLIVVIFWIICNKKCPGYVPDYPVLHLQLIIGLRLPGSSRTATVDQDYSLIGDARAVSP